MHDVLLHPFQALTWWRKYRTLRSEFRKLLSEQTEIATEEERLVHGTGGKINFPDAFILMRLLHQYRPSHILEVGSFVGFSTRWILEVTSPWGARVTSVDPNVRHRVFDAPAEILRQFTQPFSSRMEVVEAFFGEQGECTYGDYQQYEPRRSVEEAERIFASRRRIDGSWHRRFDFIFIDGDHAYEAVLRDFQIARKLLTPRGTIAFHDAFSWPGVFQALTEIKADYAGRAEVRILGALDRRIFEGWLGKSTSGIGFFQPVEDRG